MCMYHYVNTEYWPGHSFNNTLVKQKFYLILFGALYVQLQGCIQNPVKHHRIGLLSVNNMRKTVR